GDYRARRRPKPDAHLACKDSGQRRLPEPGRTVKQDVVKRLAPAFRRMDEHPQILARCLLADELVQTLGPKRRVGILGGARGIRDACWVGCHPPLIRRCMASRQAPKRGIKRMEFDRRTMLAGTAAAAMMAAPALAKGKAAAGPWFDRAIIIDALGGLSDPYA